MYLKKVAEIVAKELHINLEEIKIDTHFQNDLGADSLDAVELLMAFEEEFDVGIPDVEAQAFQTVRDVVSFLEKNK